MLKGKKTDERQKNMSKIHEKTGKVGTQYQN